MRTIKIDVYTRQEVVDMYSDTCKRIHELDKKVANGSRMTDFGRHRYDRLQAKKDRLEHWLKSEDEMFAEVGSCLIRLDESVSEIIEDFM